MSNLYDHELEKNFLSCLANKSAVRLSEAVKLLEESKLGPDDFHSPEHSHICKAAKELLSHGLAVDPLTVKTELAKQGVALDGNLWQRISDITVGDNNFVSDTVVAKYAETLRDLSSRRKLLEELREKAMLIQDRRADIRTVTASLSERLMNISMSGHRIETLGDVSKKLLVELDETQNGKRVPVVSTGFKDLDAVIGGWQPTLNMVGGLPGVGKSALLAASTRYQARAGLNVGVISLEDDPSWLAWRDLSVESGVNQFKMRWQVMNDKDYDRTAEGYKVLQGYSNRIFISDGSEHGMGISDVVNDARAMVVQHGVSSIWIDHIGEVGFNGEESRYDLEISAGLSRLRGIANKFRIPVIVFSHFKRRDGLGPGDQPKMNDFANSAGAERKARVALGLCRAPDSDTLGICVLKNTFGKAGLRVDITFIGASAILKTIEPYATEHAGITPPSASSQGKEASGLL